jgi:hypothetical protein
MLTTTGRKKLSSRLAARETASPEELTPIQSTDATTEPSGTFSQELANLTDLQTQLEQSVSNTISTTVQLTDKQFQTLLGRLASTGPNLTAPITSPLLGGDPDNSSSDSSLHGSYWNCQSRFYRQHLSSLQVSKRLPKHEDPGKLDDSISPTYTAWYILLEGKLEANADWWPTECGQINYVFSCTTGKA